ncbi:MAG TPA: hypothetical protein VG271_17890 [Beijerinckiaceae bacterium]|nr:hypothetical protein [Beijerinckiaceae bacterium]
MPVVLGLASSHTPSMFSPPELWPKIHKGLTRDVPQPISLTAETPEVVEQHAQRVKEGFRILRDELESSAIDLFVIVGDDQTEVFNDACIPAIAIFIGESVTGSTSISWVGQKHEDNHIRLQGAPQAARALVKYLIDSDFDPAYVAKLQPLGRPAAGIGHAVSRIARAMGVGDTNMPTIPVFLNGYHPPLPSGARCYALGQAMAKFFVNRPERVAIYGSGGLSHCPGGPRAGWVDEPLDRWVLERIENGEGEQLRNLFAFDSDTLRSGTGEIRSWITVAGAFDGQRGKVVDYIPSVHAVTGLGFAYWKS